MREVEAPLARTQSDSFTHIRTDKLRIACRIGLIAIAIVRAWFTRYEFNADSVAEGHPVGAVHAYWSPAYPTLLSVFLWIFRPSAYWECPLVHLANVLIFVGALASFQLFWNEVRLWHDNYVVDSCAAIPEIAFWALGYAMFAIATLSVITVALVNPDMLVAAFSCLAAWAALGFRRGPSIGRVLFLGLVLALGYYAKAPFFPMGFVFLLCACFEWPVSPRMALLGGTALVAFLLVCVPFITALSLAKGRLTFGDSARLNHAFYIDGVRPMRHWQGGPPGAGTAVHPTRKLNDFPEIYEFVARDMRTYPPWFDPSFWYEGVAPRFHWKLQGKIFVAYAALELRTIMESGAQLVCAAVLLALLASYRERWTKRFWEFWFMWAPGAVALLMFARLILLFAGVICASPLPADDGTRRAVGCVGLAVLITTGAALALQASQEAIALDYAVGRSPRNVTVAAFLLHNGLHQGDPVAVIGDGIRILGTSCTVACSGRDSR